MSALLDISLWSNNENSNNIKQSCIWKMHSKEQMNRMYMNSFQSKITAEDYHDRQMR